MCRRDDAQKGMTMSTDITTNETATQPKGKAKAAKKAKATKQAGKAKSTKAPRSTKPKNASKKERILELLRRKEGATIADIAKATDWQNHSIRGFLSGTITRKMGLILESSKDEGGERTYRITG
jgi:hypothetical protein